MNCPRIGCGGKVAVKETRTDDDLEPPRRTRECLKCGAKIWTVETIERIIPSNHHLNAK